MRELGPGQVIIFALIVACATGAEGLPRTDQADILSPPSPGLITIHLPDTTNIEPEAREQLVSAQNALASATKTSNTPAGTLADAYGTLGSLYHAYSLNAPAIECYLNAVHLKPADFRWVYLLAKLYELDGEIQKAIGYYTEALKLRTDYSPAFLTLGNIYLQLNRLGEAEQFFTRALATGAPSAAAQYGLGQAALSKRSYGEAIKYLEKALAIAPQANRLHYALAMAYRGIGETEKAREQLALSGTVGVRAADPLIDGLKDLVKGARLHLIRGRAALEARRYSDAVEEFRKAVNAQPESIPAHFNLGAALSQTGDLRSAINEFETVIRLDANYANAHYNLGLLLAQVNQHEEAIKHLRSAVAASADDNNARFLLAQELAIVFRLKEAEAEFARVVQSDPDNENALLGLVKVLLEQQKFGEALLALEKGHTQFPQKQPTAVTLAYLLAASPKVELRDGNRALELARTIYRATGLADHGKLVAMALAELGRCDEAAAMLRRLIAASSAAVTADLEDKLKAELNRYETARPCRPMGEIGIVNLPPVR